MPLALKCLHSPTTAKHFVSAVQSTFSRCRSLRLAYAIGNVWQFRSCNNADPTPMVGAVVAIDSNVSNAFIELSVHFNLLGSAFFVLSVSGAALMA